MSAESRPRIPQARRPPAAWPTVIVFGLAVAVFGFGAVRGTWAVGGSDSSCYALHAWAMARGHLQPLEPMVALVPWPDAALTFAPGGFIPSPVVRTGASPICAPGFSILLAPFVWIGGRDAVFLLGPLAGAAVVWLAAFFARRLAGPWAGAGAAAVTASIPIFLYQVVQPMNDIVVTALVMALIAAAFVADPTRPWLMGAITGLAVLVRPNLAGLTIVTGVYLAATGDEIRTGRAAARRLAAWLLAAGPAILVALTLNRLLYGHILSTGYGTAADLFSLANVASNLAHYGRAIVMTQWGLPLLGAVAVAVVPPDRRHVVWFTCATSAAVVATYLPYRSFTEWWYIRFLLPAVVPMTALAVVALVMAIGRVPGRSARSGLATAAVALLVITDLRAARAHQVFDITRLERRFRTTAELVRDRLPANAAVLTVWHSGGMRFHTDRPVILWDAMAPGWLDGSIAWLRANGLEPFFVLEDWEEAAFRARFEPHSPLAQLDWPPRWRVDQRVRVYAAADRQTYVDGSPVMTTEVRSP